MFSLSSIISPYRSTSQRVYIPENPAMLQMNAFTQAMLQTAKTQTCAVSSHFFQWPEQERSQPFSDLCIAALHSPHLWSYSC